MGGAGLAFFALIGFEDSVNVAEEARDPGRDYPRALFGGLLIAGAIYLLVTVVASMVVPTERLADSDGPLLEVVQVGPAEHVDEGLLGDRAVRAGQRRADQHDHGVADRLRHVARGHPAARPRPRARPARRTPWVAIVATTAIAMVLIVSGDLGELADTTVLLLLVSSPR